MTEETRQALDVAQREYDIAQEAEQAAGRNLVDAVTRALPSRVEALAREAVEANPDQVRALGPVGMKDLRAALAAVAEEVAEEVRQTAGTPWRGSYAQSYGASNYAVTTAMEGLFGYPEKSRLQAPLLDAGFRARPFPSDRLAQTEDHSDKLTAVADAVRAVGLAARKVDAARKANDAQDVADAWGD